MAVSMMNNLFPPIVETYQPAFIYNTGAKVSFSISPYNSTSNITYVHVSVVDQRNNENVLLGTLPDNEYFYTEAGSGHGYGIINGVLIIPFPHSTQDILKSDLIQYDRSKDLYTVEIKPEFLRKEATVPYLNNEYQTIDNNLPQTKYFNVGQYYKVQLRFDCYRSSIDDPYNAGYKIKTLLNGGEVEGFSNLATAVESFRNYLLNKRPYFSEWSEVTLIKPIFHINIDFPQLDSSTLESGLMTFNKGLNRISAAVILEDEVYHQDRILYHEYFPSVKLNGLTDETEHLEKYKILIYKADTVGNVSDELFYETDWIYAQPVKTNTGADYGINTLIDLEDVEEGDYYGLQVHLFTNNNYEYLSNFRLFEVGVLINLGTPRWNSFPTSWYEDESIGVKSNTIEVNQEDGVAKVKIIWSDSGDYTDLVPGILYIKRACGDDNFKEWKLMSVTLHSEQDLTDAANRILGIAEGRCIYTEFEDYTISSLKRYKYSAQYHTLIKPTGKQDKAVVEGSWTKIRTSAIIYPVFYEMLLQRQNRQIAIRYNGQVSAWKPVINRQKVDTLGGRYPKFVENAQMNYRQFSISGLISAEGDFNRKFLNEFAGKWVNLSKDEDDPDWTYQMFYDDDMQAYNQTFDGQYNYMVRNDTAPDGEYGYNAEQAVDPEGRPRNANNYYDPTNGFKYTGLINDANHTTSETYDHGYDHSIFVHKDYENSGYSRYFQHDLYPKDNWYWERTFRDELVAWLNDGEPKLYRSMPEGNVAVMLIDLNLTPAQQLGRRLYNFSATLYEIGDGNDLDTLDSLGIIDIPKLTNGYGETTTSTTLALEEPKDENEEDDFFASRIHQIGQMWCPNIYGIDLVRGANTPNYFSSNSSQLIWDQMTIFQRLQALYGSGHSTLKNSRILRDGAKLEWVRFRYMSKPHYYFANENTKRGPNWTQVNHEGKKTWGDNTYTTPLSIDGQQLIHVLSSPKRNWGKALLNNNSEQEINPASLSLGYKTIIDGKNYFINDRGFYQTPKGINVENIVLENNTTDNEKDKVVIDYIISYRRSNDTSEIPLKVSKIETIMGQLGGMFLYNTKVADTINKKYQLVKYQTPTVEGWYNWMFDLPIDEYFIKYGEGYVFPLHDTGGEIVKRTDVQGNEQIEYNTEHIYTHEEAQQKWADEFLSIQYEKLPKSYSQALQQWSGMSLDVTPYAVVAIKYDGIPTARNFVVGRTGVLSFIDNVPTDEVTFLGRRMVQVDKSRQPYLDEWEYVLSDQLAIEFNQLDPDPLYWIEWAKQLQDWEETKIKVAFYLGLTVDKLNEVVGVDSITNEIDEDFVYYCYSLWMDMYPDNVNKILKPKINNVYPIAVGNQTKYFIYYIDGHWYEVIPDFKYSTTDDSNAQQIAKMEEGTIVAKVPVYGYVNYTGDLLRSWFE